MMNSPSKDLKPSSLYHRQWREKNAAKYEAYQRDYAARTSAEKVAVVKKWRKTHRRTDRQDPEYAFRWRLRKRFGITPEDYDRMLVAQGGVCAICKGPSTGGKRFHVDHDHKTNKIRGLLCYNCNLAIGMMKDSADRLRAAAEYLERNMAEFHGLVRSGHDLPTIASCEVRSASLGADPPADPR